MLKVNKTLQSVNLVINSIGPDAGKSLAEALTINKSVTSIDLEHNDFDAELKRL